MTVSTELRKTVAKSLAGIDRRLNDMAEAIETEIENLGPGNADLAAGLRLLSSHVGDATATAAGLRRSAAFIDPELVPRARA